MSLAACSLKPVSPDQMTRLHDATLRILAETGIVFESEEALAIFKKHGARVEGRTVFIDEKMVDDAIQSAPSTYRHRGRNDARSILVGHRQKRLVLSGAYGPVNIYDPENGRRPGTMEDFINLTKLSHALDSVSVVGGLPVDPSDLEPKHKTFQMLYQILRHTDKPIWAFSSLGEDVLNMFKMVEIAYGSSAQVWEEHVVAAPVCPLSPLKYARTASETILTYARHRQPLYINSCIMAGVSGPISLLGTATLMNTEILGGLVLAQLTAPGTPIVYVPGGTVADMRSGSYICGSPESNLIVMVGLQMALDQYLLPTRVMGGLTDSKAIDYQAGAEVMQNLFMPILAGAHFLNNVLGTMESQMTVSLGKYLLDVESIERVVRVMEGISGDDTDLSVDLIQQEAHKGNYLMNPSTLKKCRSRWQPSIADWDTYNKWQKGGSLNAEDRGHLRSKEILANSPDSLLPKDIELDLRKYAEKRVSVAI
ncbi:trimethylamine methyltransferase family protein [Desulforhopalus singaporensis]|uniref:Trimethylamine---corrinoid protein Co-methyltransferase n=1 Tax=Desulforhopalus singaporensis TaxID=91360 RepID=A0A1H0UEG5_9BACT|nr:trimethylamine methyltransferase family protein [Desulforhopalus singaporensis]SDP64521.1 trimethylamine---corrinoid protein Co-methyltransferase [Desulforhopalus singaporensis]